MSSGGGEDRGGVFRSHRVGGCGIVQLGRACMYPIRRDSDAVSGTIWKRARQVARLAHGPQCHCCRGDCQTAGTDELKQWAGGLKAHVVTQYGLNQLKYPGKMRTGSCKIRRIELDVPCLALRNGGGDGWHTHAGSDGWQREGVASPMETPPAELRLGWPTTHTIPSSMHKQKQKQSQCKYRIAKRYKIQVKIGVAVRNILD